MALTPMDERYIQLMALYGWTITDTCNCDGAHWKIYTNVKPHLRGVEIRIAPDRSRFKVIRNDVMTLDQMGYDVLSQVVPRVTQHAA